MFYLVENPGARNIYLLVINHLMQRFNSYEPYINIRDSILTAVSCVVSDLMSSDFTSCVT
jgi:hypothetical protein